MAMRWTDRPIQTLTAISRGCGLPAESYDGYTASRHAIRTQTEVIADRLEAAGIRARDHDRDLWIVGELTGAYEPMPGFRRLHLLPEFAHRHRHKMIRKLAYFLANHSKGRPCRYAVVTSGQRVSWFGDLHGQRAAFLDRINRWSSEARTRYGIELIYRGDNDTLCRREGTTADGVNLHADLIYRPKRRLSHEAWSRFLSWSRGRLGGVHWRDCGALRDPASVVKYVLKLSWGKNGLSRSDQADGLIGIDEMEPEELAWYYRETLNATRVKPLRGFHDFCKALDDGKQEIRWVPRRDGELARELRRVRRPRLNRRPAGRAQDGQPRHPENIVLGRTAPHPRFSDVCEPCSIVMGFTDRPTTEIGRSGIGMIIARAAQATAWAKRNTEAAAVKVHYGASEGPTSFSSISSCNQSLGQSLGVADNENQPPIVLMRSTSPEDGQKVGQEQEIQREYRLTWADYEALATFYRELLPGVTEQHLRTAIISSAAFYSGPITPKVIGAMRSKMTPRPTPAPIATIIPMPTRPRRTKCFTPEDYAAMDRMAA